MAGEAVRELSEKFGENDVFLTSNEAAAMLRRSAGTLETWRRLGKGPDFIRVNGRPLYPLSDIRAFSGRNQAA